MANRRTASPGSGAAPRTVARSRSGVASGDRPRMRTGATTTRGPAAPGLSTSMTQPSTTVGRSMAGAIGAATASVRSLATAIPSAKHANSISPSVHTRASPIRRAPNQSPAASTAPAISGQTGGSVFREK